jgi:hypothetical protein
MLAQTLGAEPTTSRPGACCREAWAQDPRLYDLPDTSFWNTCLIMEPSTSGPVRYVRGCLSTELNLPVSQKPIWIESAIARPTWCLNNWAMTYDRPDWQICLQGEGRLISIPNSSLKHCSLLLHTQLQWEISCRWNPYLTEWLVALWIYRELLS